MLFNITNGILNEYLGKEEVVTVPEGVTKIGNNAFYWNESIKKVILPEGLKIIGENAFYFCDKLEDINIPSSVTEIQSGAFGFCDKLKKIVIPENAYFSKTTFSSCKNLDITATFKSLKGNTFFKYLLEDYFHEYLPPRTIRLYLGGDIFDKSCPPNAEKIKLPIREVHVLEGVKDIPYRTFDRCSALATVTLPSSLKTIGELVFRGCGLTSINIPENLTSINWYAFDNAKINSLYISDELSWCNIDFKGNESNPIRVTKEVYINGKRATTFNIPEGVTEIKPYAFVGANALEKIIIPDTVTKIGKSAFKDFANLQEISIPDSVEIIEDGAFENCVNLSKINIPKNTKLGNNVFKNTKIKNLDIGAIYLDTTLIRCQDFAQFLVVENGTKRVENEAFLNCISLTTVVLPTTIESIGYNAFFKCENLKCVIFADDTKSVNVNDYIEQGVYINDLNKYLNIDFTCETSSPLYFLHSLFVNGELVKDLVISSNQQVGNYSFAGAKCLESVTLQEGVKKVGELSFVKCSNIKKITLPSTLTDIQFSSFYTLTYKDIEIITTGKHSKTLENLVRNGTNNPTNLAACTTCYCAPLCKLVGFNHYQCDYGCFHLKDTENGKTFIFNEEHSGLYKYAESDSGQDSYLKVENSLTLEIPNSVPNEEITMYILEHLNLAKKAKSETEF